MNRDTISESHSEMASILAIVLLVSLYATYGCSTERCFAGSSENLTAGLGRVSGVLLLILEDRVYVVADHQRLQPG